MNINVLTSGNKIKRTAGAVSLGTPKALKPKDTCPSAGIKIPTHTTKPRLRKSPLIHKKRAAGLPHACVMMKDGYSDFDAAGVRLPNSVARPKVRTSPAASLGEMAKIRFEVAMRMMFFVSAAMNSTKPRMVNLGRMEETGTRFVPG